MDSNEQATTSGSPSPHSWQRTLLASQTAYIFLSHPCSDPERNLPGPPLQLGDCLKDSRRGALTTRLPSEQPEPRVGLRWG